MPNAEPSLLTTLLPLLTLLGGAALVHRLVRALLRLAITAAEKTAVAGLRELSARRGDLTGMAEHGAAERRLVNVRRGAAALAVSWLLLLAVPVLSDAVALVYPFAAVLWLAPRHPLRALPRRAPDEDGAQPPAHR